MIGFAANGWNDGFRTAHIVQLFTNCSTMSCFIQLHLSIIDFHVRFCPPCCVISAWVLHKTSYICSIINTGLLGARQKSADLRGGGGVQVLNQVFISHVILIYITYTLVIYYIILLKRFFAIILPSNSLIWINFFLFCRA